MSLLILLIIIAVLFGGFGFTTYGAGIAPGYHYGGIGALVILILVLYLLGVR
jgi:uncharacterized BrkB/YihY/UPF0761 family membrane protein